MDGSTEALQQLLVKLLAVVDRLDARNLQTVQRLETATAAMEQGVGRLDRGGEQFAQQALQRIGADAQQSIAQGAGRAVTEFQQQLQQAAHGVHWAAQAMDEQRKGLAAARRSLLWIATMALLTGSLLAAGGAAWIAHRSMQEIAQADFGKDILQATRSGAITWCGDALCVRIGKKPQHYGKEGEYVLLQDLVAR